MLSSNHINTYIKAKRVFDCLVAATLFLLLSPLMLTIAALVKLTSPGPAFFPWQVVGGRGRYFTGYKFRSMYQNATEMKAKLWDQNEMTGPVFKMTHDPRVTPIGKFLRKYSLDELPQLWSVIKGDMSPVGPRPPLQSEYECFTPWQKQKLSVQPGITCIWQTTGRNDIQDFNEWVKLDLKYIQERNFTMDLKILLDTLKCTLKGTGK
jgi:lipopolysaccharide/colanic/teichoic acid biosynthesis glycosyltransferase